MRPATWISAFLLVLMGLLTAFSTGCAAASGNRSGGVVQTSPSPVGIRRAFLPAEPSWRQDASRGRGTDPVLGAGSNAERHHPLKPE